MTDAHPLLDRAIDLALRGWGRVHPNPLVGCVIAQGDRVIGEGWHAEYGGPHAEVMALEAAGEAARGATAYVSLEPCAHWGKQPPCVDALLKAGIARVVYALDDPNPAAAGGAERLQAAGVQVERGAGAERVRAQNAAWLHALREHERPWVTLKLATSVDARIADSAGRSTWVSGEVAREWVHWLRAGYDGIAVGGETARADDPALTVRGSVVPRVAPARVVFSRRAELPLDGRLVATAEEVPVIVVAGAEAEAERVAVLAQRGVRVPRAVTLPGALRALRGLGVASLLVEGGGQLAGALLAAGLVDRFCWVQSPLWLGDAGRPAFAGLPAVPIREAARWCVVERRALGDDTLLVLDRPGSSGTS